MTPDEALELRLRALAASHDPVPALVTASAKAAFELRDLDRQLADLVADSWADAGLVATRDATATVRMLTFAAAESSIEVDVDYDDGSESARLHGLVTGVGSELVVERGDSRSTVPLIDGQFEVEGLPTGPLRLSVTDAGAVLMTTPWFTI
jgi:hypothetical protein